EMANAGGLGCLRQFSGRQAIDPIIQVLGDLRAGVRDAGQMDHRLDPFKKRAPFDRAGQVGDRHHLDIAWEHIRLLPPPNAATVLRKPGHTTLAAASATSAKFRAKTWVMIWRTLNPRSVASW